MEIKQAREFFIKGLEWSAASLVADINKFAVKLTANDCKDAHHAMSWGSEMVAVSAKLAVVRAVLAAINEPVAVGEEPGDEDDRYLFRLEEVRTTLKREVMRAARYPERSSAPMANLAAQELTAARCWMLEELRG